MADEVVIKTIQFKRGSKENLERRLVAGDLGVPLAGEPIFEFDKNDPTTGKLKIGNGVSSYKNLPYISGSGGEDNRFIIHDPQQNQILIYDARQEGWVNVNVEPTFGRYIQQARDAATQANTYASQAGSSASEAIQAANIAVAIPAEAVRQVNEFITNKIQFMDAEEYNTLTTIDPDTYYFVTTEVDI